MTAHPDGMGDWRIEVVARIKEGHLPGGSVKAGDLVTKITVTKDVAHGEVNFPTPSPCALALSIAIAACQRALDLRRTHTYPEQMRNGSRAINLAAINDHYEYFEQFMVAVTFAFHAVESYCNRVVAAATATSFTIKRKAGDRTFTPEDLERFGSIEDKLSQVLPEVTGVPFPKGTKLWQRFKELKDLRDSTIHFKSYHHYVRGMADRRTLYFRWLNTDPKACVRTAIQVIRHFCKQHPERWLDPAEEKLSRPSGVD